MFVVTKMFEVLGEASVKLQNMGFVVQYPDIPWRDIKDFRNVCAHTYFSINIRQMWEIAKNDVPDVFENDEYYWIIYEFMLFFRMIVDNSLYLCAEKLPTSSYKDG